jgi:anti-sigma-K factor RskA
VSDAVHVTDLAAGYALGALSPDERAMVDAHIAGCEDCRGDLAAMVGLASLLPLACDSVAPPASLKERVLEAAVAEARAGASIARRPLVADGSAPRGPRMVPAAWTWIAGAAAAAAIVMGIVTTGTMRERDALRAQVSSMSTQLSQAALTTASLQHEADAGHAVMTAFASGRYWTVGPHQDANGRMWRCAVVQPPARGHNAMLLAEVPEPPHGMAYQVWVRRKGTPHKAGMVMHGGMTMMDMPMPLQKGDVVAFSVEPMSGSASPTSPYMMEIAI